MDLLQAANGGRDPSEIRAALEAATRAGHDRLWVPRNVARLYREMLADFHAARQVLEELAPLTCSEWRLTAAAWAELGDTETATRCLERAATNARTATDLCTIAMGYRDAGFVDEGRLLVQGAEAIATRALDCWAVATTYDLFGQREQAVAMLDRALLDAVGVDELVLLAHALAAYEATTERLAGVLREGERRASTVRDWIELAASHHYLELDPDAADRCAAQASQIATTPDHERAIAEVRCRGMGMPLLDDERPKLAPDRLLRPGARSLGWDRDPAKLLGWLRARVPRSTIDGMTRPGEFFANDDLIALLEIVKNGRIPHPLPAFLEVLYRVAAEVGPAVDHLRRAFALTVLVLDDAAHAGSRDNDARLALLLESCIELGTGAVEGALALFAALADSYEATHATVHEAYMVLFAELGLVLAAIWLDPSDPRIAPTVERMMRDDRRHRGHARHRYSDWVVGFGSVGAGVGLWYQLADRILIHPRYDELARLLTAGSGA